MRLEVAMQDSFAAGCGLFLGGLPAQRHAEMQHVHVMHFLHPHHERLSMKTTDVPVRRVNLSRKLGQPCKQAECPESYRPSISKEILGAKTCLSVMPRC